MFHQTLKQSCHSAAVMRQRQHMFQLLAVALRPSNKHRLGLLDELCCHLHIKIG